VNGGLLTFRDSRLSSALLALVSVCGVAFIFSMPSATYVSELIQSPFRRPTPIVFYGVVVLSIAFYAAQRGAAAVPLKDWRATCLTRIAVQVLLGLLFLTPFFIYLRVILLPGDRMEILWVALYAGQIGWLAGVAGHWFEIAAVRRGRETVAVRTIWLLSAFLLPVPFRLLGGALRYVMYISPFSAVERLHAGASPTEVLTLVLIPAMATVLLLIGTALSARRIRV